MTDRAGFRRKASPEVAGSTIQAFAGCAGAGVAAAGAACDAGSVVGESTISRFVCVVGAFSFLP